MQGGPVGSAQPAPMEQAHSDREEARLGAPGVGELSAFWEHRVDRPVPALFLLAFKLYPPSPLSNLFHPARVFINSATRLCLSLANDSIGPSAVLLHHLKRLF